MKAFIDWRFDCLGKYVNKQRASSRVVFIGNIEKLGMINIAQILVDIFSKLKNNQCVSAKDSLPLFDLIYSDSHTINPEEVLSKMVNLGFLIRSQLEGINYYHYHDSLQKKSYCS